MRTSTPPTYDLAVIGGGPGGYPAALRAAQLGLRTVLVESQARLGGVCLHWGCIPTKALLRQAEVLRLARRGADFGLRLRGEPAWSWDAVIESGRQAAADLAAGIDQLMRRHGVEVVHGRARLTPERAVHIHLDGGHGRHRTLQARRLLLATGGQPRSLPGIDIDGQRVIGSRQALNLPRRPASLVIVGGGAMGVEFASFFAAYGTRVTLLEAQAQLLPGQDAEAAAVLAAALEDQGVTVHTGARVTGVEAGPRRRTATVAFETKDGVERMRAERVLMAVGVVGNTCNLGLEALGVQVEAGHVVVDDEQATTVRGIWAVGDLVGAPYLAHAATAAGVAAVEAMAGRRRRPVGPIPTCIYTEPQVASVGLTEGAARARGIEVKVGRFPWTASGRARAGRAAQGFVKLVFGVRYGELLGGVIVGSEATELIGEIGLALALEATWEELAHTVHAHPTLSEGIMEAAAAAFDQAIHI